MWIKRASKIINLRTGLTIAMKEMPVNTFHVDVIFLSGESDHIFSSSSSADQLAFFNLIWHHLLRSETGLCLDTQI